MPPEWFARMLLNRPSWVFMDEGTSALVDESQANLMSLSRDELSATSLLSIGHRPGLDQFHDRTLTLVHGPEGARLVRKHRQQPNSAPVSGRPLAAVAARLARLRKRREAKQDAVT
jgi:putative ATP-binding cassette transporter